MLKNILVISLAFLGGILYSEEADNLSFYKETEHFQTYCIKEDAGTAEEVLQDLEQYYEKCSRDFQYSPSSSKKIRLNLYPNIQNFHEACNEKILTDWKVSRYSSEDNTLSLANPKKSGSIHTEETAIKSAKYALGCYFMNGKCAFSPPWPSVGLALYESRVYSAEQLREHLLMENGKISMPSLSQIDEQIENKEFDSRAIPIAAYAYVEFLVTNWGMDKALAILENYSAFESTLEISQEEFQEKCSQHYQETLL